MPGSSHDGLAQLAARQIVALEVMGSNPISVTIDFCVLVNTHIASMLVSGAHTPIDIPTSVADHSQKHRNLHAVRYKLGFTTVQTARCKIMHAQSSKQDHHQLPSHIAAMQR